MSIYKSRGLEYTASVVYNYVYHSAYMVKYDWSVIDPTKWNPPKTPTDHAVRTYGIIHTVLCDILLCCVILLYLLAAVSLAM